MGMIKGQVTINDLARELGIAASTVSRALKDHPDISAKTKKKVSELAKKMDYQPNSIAMSLQSSKTHTIGVIVPELVHFFFSTVISGIEDVAYDAGYNVLVCCSHGSSDREVSVSKLLLNRRIDGLILCVAKNAKSDQHLNDYKDRGIPIVFFDCSYNSIQADQVIIDDFKSAELAVKHLLNQGCKSIAYLGGSPTLLINQQRFRGYKSALEGHNIALDPLLIHHVEEGNIEEGQLVARKFLSEPKKIDGIFATADSIAIGAMKEIKDSGLKVPDDIAIVGFGNSDISKLLEPALSSVLQPGHEMGVVAMQMLLQRIDKDEGDPRTKILDTELLVRMSSMRK